VAQAGRGLRLTHDPLRAWPGGERLDRDGALEALVARPIDGAEAATPELVDDPEPVQDEAAFHLGFDFSPGPPPPPSEGGVILSRAKEPGGTVEFLDEPFSSGGTAPRRRRPPPPGGRPPPPDRHQQIVVRRAVAAGVAILILILLVLGVRGCLNARQERAYENYVSDLSSIAAETQNLSQQFFGRLKEPGNLSPLQFEAEIKADRGAAEGLLDRAEGLDAPDELSSAQDLIVLSYELRRDGLAVISDRIASALADEGSGQAISQIAREMRTFVASDVLYARAVAQIQAVLEDEEIAVPEGEQIATVLP
jgi:hypothetical protein